MTWSSIILHLTLFSVALVATAKGDMEAVFKKYDVNNDGKMSNTELAEALKELEVTLKPDLLNAIAEHYDRPPRNGFLELAEFTTLASLVTDLKAIDASKREEVLQHFIDLDMDKNGYIDDDDLKKALESVGMESDDATALAAVTSTIADINSDGKITIVELARYLEM